MTFCMRFLVGFLRQPECYCRKLIGLGIHIAACPGSTIEDQNVLQSQKWKQDRNIEPPSCGVCGTEYVFGHPWSSWFSIFFRLSSRSTANPTIFVNHACACHSYFSLMKIIWQLLGIIVRAALGRRTSFSMGPCPDLFSSCLNLRALLLLYFCKARPPSPLLFHKFAQSSPLHLVLW